MVLAELRAGLTWVKGPDTEGGAADEVTRPPWLSEAHESPALFWQDHTTQLMDEPSGAPRSAAFEWYDLFFEMGKRHVSGTRPAFSDYSLTAGFAPISYQSITKGAEGLAARWRKAGVGPGTTVGVCLPQSHAYPTCLLAAWHCGAAVSCIAPTGPWMVRRAISALLDVVAEAKDGPPEGEPRVFVVLGSQARGWPEKLEVEYLDWDTASLPQHAAPAQPHRFAAGDVAGWFFSDLSGEGILPIALSAEQLYLGACRDGLLILDLRPGTSVAAPGFCEQQYKPSLLFACLAAGAHYMEVAQSEVADGTALLTSPIDVLGVHGRLRDKLLQQKWGKKIAVQRWFRDLAGDFNVKAWGGFSQRMAQRGALGTNYIANTAAGGSILFSPWGVHPESTGVWLSPGQPCVRKEPNGTTLPALADVAELVPADDLAGLPGVRLGLHPLALGRPVVVNSGETDVWVTNLGSHRQGKVLPEQEMELVLMAAFPKKVRASVLVRLPTHSGTSKSRVALLVYFWPEASGVPSAKQITKVLSKQLGVARVPDEIEVLELNPALIDPSEDALEVDKNGCAGQYISGTLWEKSRRRVFREIASVAKDLTSLRVHRQKSAP